MKQYFFYLLGQRGLFAYGNTTQTHSRYDFAPGVLDELPGAGYTDFLSGKQVNSTYSSS